MQIDWIPETRFRTSGEWGHACVYAPDLDGRLVWCVWDRHEKADADGFSRPTAEGKTATVDEAKAAVEAEIAKLTPEPHTEWSTAATPEGRAS